MLAKLQTNFMSFKKLDDDDIDKYRSWARGHYECFTPISGVWHPVVQAECALMNHEQANYVMEAREPDEDEEVDERG